MAKRSAIAIVALFMGLGAIFGIHQAQALTSYADLQAGDLIRGETFTAVYYYGVDGLRYVFTNDKAYFTWYSNFDSVKWISDTDLAKIQIGGNVTYKPGIKMVKVNSDPDTYAVGAGGSLRLVTSESLAVALYGSNWNTKIDDIADGFFKNYTVGSDINSTSDYSPSSQTASATSIGVDKGLVAPEEIEIGSSGFDPVCVGIEVGQGVRFINADDSVHSVTADNLTWGTGTMQAGDEYIKVFKDDGVYSFYDGYDSSNTGAVYVGSYSDDCE